MNFRRRPFLCTTLHRNPKQVSNFGGTFDQLFLWICLWHFDRRCVSTFSIPWCKKVKNDQKLKSRGSCLKIMISKVLVCTSSPNKSSESAKDHSESVHNQSTSPVYRYLWALRGSKAWREMPVISRQIGQRHDRTSFDKHQKEKKMAQANTRVSSFELEEPRSPSSRLIILSWCLFV